MAKRLLKFIEEYAERLEGVKPVETSDQYAQGLHDGARINQEGIAKTLRFAVEKEKKANRSLTYAQKRNVEQWLGAGLATTVETITSLYNSRVEVLAHRKLDFSKPEERSMSTIVIASSKNALVADGIANKVIEYANKMGADVKWGARRVALSNKNKETK